MRFLALAAALLLAACSGAGDEASKQQRELAAATQQARAKLPYFWEHFTAPEVDEYDFILKVDFPAPPGVAKIDPAWVEKIARGAGGVTGELMVDPGVEGGPGKGAIMTFPEKAIVDWAFLRGEELIGHYTTRVLLPTMPPEQADGLKSMFGENPK